MTVILFMANSLHSTLTNTSVCMHSQSQHNQEAHFDFFCKCSDRQLWQMKSG